MPGAPPGAAWCPGMPTGSSLPCHVHVFNAHTHESGAVCIPTPAACLAGRCGAGLGQGCGCVPRPGAARLMKWGGGRGVFMLWRTPREGVTPAMVCDGERVGEGASEKIGWGMGRGIGW